MICLLSANKWSYQEWDIIMVHLFQELFDIKASQLIGFGGLNKQAVPPPPQEDARDALELQED